MSIHINGVPVHLQRAGDRWEARVGVFRLLTVYGQTAASAMEQVAALLGTSCRDDAAA